MMRFAYYETTSTLSKPGKFVWVASFWCEDIVGSWAAGRWIAKQRGITNFDCGCRYVQL
jgi:hypothetical protein